MAIVTVKNLSGREADWGLRNDSSYRRSWLATTDTRYEFEGQLLQDGIGLGYFPVTYFSTHPNDVRFVAKKLTGKQEKNSPLHWIVDAYYDTKPWQDMEQDKEPLDRRALISWSTVKYQKALERDRAGDTILNSAGYYFDPPPLKDLSRWTATVRKNVGSVPTDVLSYPDSLNNAAWMLGDVPVDKNAAKIMSIQISDLQKEQDEEYYIFTYVVEFDEDLWKGKYLNQGFYDKTGARILDNSTPPKPVAYPWPLDRAGAKIINPTPATASYQPYDIYLEMDFSVLPVA